MEQKEQKTAYDRDRYTRQKAEREAKRPPDAIDLLTEVEVAYIAGIVDGDGSIFVAAVGPERSRTVYPIVCVAMTHLPVIQWLTKRLDAGTVKNHVRYKAHYKPLYRTQVFGKRAQKLCERMLPYLIVKHEQARLVTTFPVDARIAPGVKIERSDINKARYDLRDMINGLNH